MMWLCRGIVDGSILTETAQMSTTSTCFMKHNIKILVLIDD